MVAENGEVGCTKEEGRGKAANGIVSREEKKDEVIAKAQEARDTEKAIAEQQKVAIEQK